MICIFCYEVSDNSKSIEHIIPESLGNKEHTLWKGAVCDKCNNYFATKIEKELLDQPYFVSVRHRNIIETKKNRLVQQTSILKDKRNNLEKVLFKYDGQYGMITSNPLNKKAELIIPSIGKIIEPVVLEPEPNNYVLSRFLAKCAYEFLVYRTKKENLSEYLKDKQFELLRKYARYGEGCKIWPYSQRRIYGEGDMFIGLKRKKPYEILNAMDFLAIELERKIVDNIKYVVAEVYFILVIMGIEYSFHIGEPDISGYYLWLQKNNFKSPIFRYDEVRIPNMNTNTPQITEELIKRMKNDQ
jgi:hypothetical protein